MGGSHTRTVASIGAASLALAAIGLVLWERAPYNTESSPFDNDVWYGYNPPGIQGIMLFLTFATFSVVVLFEALDISLHRVWTSGTLRDRKLALGLHGACGLVLIVVAVLALVTWGAPVLACGVVLCVDTSVYNNWPAIRGDSFNVCIALSVGIAFICLGVLFLLRTAKWRRQLASTEPPPEIKADQVQLYVFSWRRPLTKLLLMLVVLAALFFFSGYLPNDARRWTSAFMAGYASLEASKDAVGYSYVYPELPGAWTRSGNILMGHAWVIKIYPSNVIFYASAVMLLVLVFALQLSRRLLFLRDTRIRMIPQFTVGDVALFCGCITIFGIFFFYWIHDHNFKGMWSPATPAAQMSLAERWGRALGQLAVIVFAFLMLPAPRYSILYDVLGLSRESLLWLHRWFGYGMLATTVGHIIAFLVYFYEAGTLSHNLFHIPTLIGDVRNDFTVILITWATLFLFVAMGGLALNVVRRAYYELFYYAHLFSSYLMIPAILWHAHSAWMYVLPAVALWFADQMMRVRQRAGHATILSVRTVGSDVIELLCNLSGNKQLSVVHPGQYVYLNIPEIAVLQWHPFTLTSVVPSEGHRCPLVMHIKSMGEKTWSDKLYNMTKEQRSFTVRLEGPCGVPLDLTHYNRICLVGGGIGVVPCVSIYGSLRNTCASGDAHHHKQHVQMLWATRSAALAAAMTNYMDLPASWSALAGGQLAGQSPPSLSREKSRCFRCDLFVTVKDEFDCFRRCESIPSAREAAKESTAGLSDADFDASATALGIPVHQEEFLF